MGAAMNKVFVRIAGAAGVFLFAAGLPHSFRTPPPPAARRARLEVPEPLPAPSPVPETRRAPAPGRAEEGPERLLRFLEQLGRARVVKDRRTLDDLLRRVPPLFDGDFAW